ncbi:hypothetical protein [Amycolatopsis sp. NBRC 101858]|uniref:hypothetical protein n=1 Tax=Amycolatopsis sp. NBRC 101858 TaxID=3032200 RepID=UPI00255534E7|nr:hypothetical protein [Amycolatopsis sp. NBRC 101858]
MAAGTPTVAKPAIAAPRTVIDGGGFDRTGPAPLRLDRVIVRARSGESATPGSKGRIEAGGEPA